MKLKILEKILIILAENIRIPVSIIEEELNKADVNGDKYISIAELIKKVKK